MKKVLITGGAGFIGSHLCERLLNDGNEVICPNNFVMKKKYFHKYFKRVING